jgi:tetratricopeptide (TPR) repeat protein
MLPVKENPFAFPLLLAALSLLSLASCVSKSAQAEDYYSIGMAYYSTGKFNDAEKWLIRARDADRTMTASEYQLGRIAFEHKRYTEAVRYFESILKKDDKNVLALEAAAYARIKMGDTDRALVYYRRVLDIVPESADDGYNYALLLYAAGKYAESEEVISKYEYNLPGNADVQLLLSRVEDAQDKPEAIDSYALYLANNADAKARCEFARTLEKHDFYARAIEAYQKALEELTKETETLKKVDIRFEIARLLFIADSDDAALAELQGAITDGFSDRVKIDALLADSRLSQAAQDGIKAAVDKIRSAEQPAEDGAADADDAAAEDDAAE